MKKFLILLIFISTPAFALCPVDTAGESVCSISNTTNNSLPIFQSPSAASNLNTPQGKLEPLYKDNTLNNQLNSQNDSIMKYNSGCQFGICVQDLNNTKNKNQ